MQVEALDGPHLVISLYLVFEKTVDIIIDDIFLFCFWYLDPKNGKRVSSFFFLGLGRLPDPVTRMSVEIKQLVFGAIAAGFVDLTEQVVFFHIPKGSLPFLSKLSILNPIVL